MERYCGLFCAEDAHLYEVPQVLASGCGVTSLLNVLVTLKIAEISALQSLDVSMCTLRKRSNEAALPQYLESRSVAGCTGQDLVDSMGRLLSSNHSLLGGATVEGKFWSMAAINGSSNSLAAFITEHIEAGHCLVATLNLQLFGNDAWHHQMIFGITNTAAADGSRAIVHMMNPIEAYPVKVVQRLISTPSILLVRKEDIVLRYDRETEDCAIYSSPLWKDFTVPAQIEAVMEATRLGATVGGPNYVVIPANYVGGIAVFKHIS
jgi:hypothetical protein